MQTVRDGDGRRYLRLKRSADSSLVRDPATGEERYLPNAALEVVDGEPPLSTAARAVPADVRRVVRVAGSDRALGLLVELADRGPLSVRELLAAYDLCESDLHGVLASLRVAGVVAETTVAGERGYELDPSARDALARLRAGDDEPDADTDGAGTGTADSPGTGTDGATDGASPADRG